MKFALAGFLFALIIHSNPFSGCSPDNDMDPDPSDPDAELLDVNAAKRSAEALEKAFTDADVEQILDMMTPLAVARSGDDITNADPERLKQFASDFNDRKIAGYGTEFIEFSFQLEGVPYTVDFALQEDGSFKVIRL